MEIFSIKYDDIQQVQNGHWFRVKSHLDFGFGEKFSFCVVYNTEQSVDPFEYLNMKFTLHGSIYKPLILTS